jgi:hypothetical protein
MAQKYPHILGIFRAEESTIGVPLNAQAQTPDISAGNANGKATRLRRVPDFTESLHDLAPAAGSSPRRLVSFHPTYFDDTLAKLVGKWCRQIIPLGIWHTFSLGINIPILKAPRFSHTLAAPGPNRQAAPQLFARAVEAALGVSFNTQSQAPDKP